MSDPHSTDWLDGYSTCKSEMLDEKRQAVMAARWSEFKNTVIALLEPNASAEWKEQFIKLRREELRQGQDSLGSATIKLIVNRVLEHCEQIAEREGAPDVAIAIAAAKAGHDKHMELLEAGLQNER